MKRRNALLGVLFISTSAGFGCGPSGAGDGLGAGEGADGGGAIGGGGQPTGDAGLVDSFEGCDQMDILFVIDDSGSMQEEQANLAANFPSFVEVINNFSASNGQPIDYRLAVTTTGVSKRWERKLLGIPIGDDQSGDNGSLMNPGCLDTRPWLERTDADPGSIFTCLASVGTSGPAVEMPLEAMRLAVDERVADGANADFFREDALLGVVVLSDENDCSRLDNNFDLGSSGSICDDVEPVETFVNALDTFKGDRGKWATAVISAGLDDCSSDLGDAQAAERLMEFADQTGDNAITSSICEGDLSGALQRALETFDAACQTFPSVD